MCAIFGLLDYKGSLSPAERLRIIRALGKAAEVRGTDATGIAYVQNGTLRIQKAPRPARRMRYRISPEARYIMGHTRMTTQGSPQKNENNHPFPGKAGEKAFALAHNGVLFNDHELRRVYRLPHTKIETDSYVAVQMIEQQKELSFQSLRTMAEDLQGSFTFTVLDTKNSLYIIKGNNPVTLMLLPRMGIYLYASTEEILEAALAELGMSGTLRANIKITQGNIMKIDARGNRTVERFDDTNICLRQYYGCCGYYDWYPPVSTKKSSETDAYLEEVIRYGVSRGIPEKDLRRLVDYGYDTFDIEELLFEPELRQCCLDEITCELGVW